MMQAFLHRARILCFVLALAILNLSLLQSPLRAELIATDSAIASPAAGDLPRARVLAALERADVQVGLQSYGVDPNEAMVRVDSLSDAEVAGLAQRLDDLPAGQNYYEAGAFLFGPLLFILFVALIVWLVKQVRPAQEDAKAAAS